MSGSEEKTDRCEVEDEKDYRDFFRQSADNVSAITRATALGCIATVWALFINEDLCPHGWWKIFMVIIMGWQLFVLLLDGTHFFIKWSYYDKVLDAIGNAKKQGEESVDVGDDWKLDCSRRLFHTKNVGVVIGLGCTIGVLIEVILRLW